MVNKYRKPFLKSVIARVDFDSPVRKGHDELPKALRTQALRLFPILEPKTFIIGQVEWTKGASRQMQEEGINWVFHGKEREKILTIAPDHFDISYEKYDCFEALVQDFIPVTTAISDAYKDLQAIRFGLRYINHVILDETNVFEWHDYLNQELLTIFNVPQDKDTICRAFHNLSMNYGDMILSFQYGMHNPDFPALIRRKLFILDYDAYYQGLQDMNEICQNLHKFHDRIEALFETCVSDGLREIMGVIRDA